MLRRQRLATTSRSSSCPLLMRIRHQAASTKDQRRNQPNADPQSGHQTQMCEPPDFTSHSQFSQNVLENISVPEIPFDRRSQSDLEKDRAMKVKFGELGPGDRPDKNSAGVRRDMLQKAQDMDGLPWEVRWKKTLIPTPEEVVQDIRDRFDLYIQDPIDRDVEWYLHWKDRTYRMQKDRLIWPQGYTDHLDHYDQYGRRRVLPSDQRWSDTSWKYLTDVKYRDRMWLIEGEERKAVHLQLTGEAELIAEEEKRQLDSAEILAGLASGVIDLDPDQAYQALSGTADPLEVAKTKAKLNSYGAAETLMMGKTTAPRELDPISGFPKSELKPLASGITVEQASAISMKANVQRELFEQAAENAHIQGKDGVLATLQAHRYTSKKAGDQPMLSTMVEGKVEQTLQLQQKLNAAQQQGIAGGGMTQDTKQLGETMEALESSISSQIQQQQQPLKSGFVDVAPRPRDAEPNISRDLYHTPSSRSLEEMPEWYEQQAINTQPLIKSYGMVQDPIEMRELPDDAQYFTKNSSSSAAATTRSSLLEDDAWFQANSFDESKLQKLATTPELTREFKPLPLFKEAAKASSSSQDDSKAVVMLGEDGKPLKRSERLRRERIERQRKAKLNLDPDMMLPSLPWETDSVPDPYRGVADALDAPEVNKPNLEKAWMTYRGFFQQTLVEFHNLQRTVTEDKCNQLLNDSMLKIRKGEVGAHPEIDKEQLDVIQLVFEAHMKQFMSDFFRYRNVKNTESQTLKSEADDMLRKASAKSKLLGKGFMDFIQEMTSMELDSVRKNPVQRHTIILRDKKLEGIARPFGKWFEQQLAEFCQTEYDSLEQLDTYKEHLMRTLKEARFKTPSRIEGVSDSLRDATVEALFHWCAGNLHYYSAKEYFRMSLVLGETRFRSKAEESFETATEYFEIGYKASKDSLTLPIPNCDPPYEYDEKDFTDGEHAVFAEMIGNFSKAESLWCNGTTKRWYPLLDETEFMWFCERRGRFSLAVDVSDRCFENLNKRTHPSVHPFPDRARPFLEGAPLTQETAEHLWMRYMGDVYMEHAEFMNRIGRYDTSANYREKSLNLHHLALRTAKERLPSTWQAPLLTEAKYLMNMADPTQEPKAFMAQVDTLMEKLYAMKPRPSHWIDPTTELPIRVALFGRVVPLICEWVIQEAAKVAKQPSPEELMKFLATRARGGEYTEHEWFAATDKAAEKLLRQRVLKWRAKELEGTDPYYYWTHMYFTIRVQPKNRDMVQEYWNMYEPVFLHVYTQTALSSRPRGIVMLGDTVRRMCQILLPGDAEQHAILMKELVKVREKMAHIIDRKDLDRTINALEAHLLDPRTPTYVYGTSMLHKEAKRLEAMRTNPVLTIDLAAKDYKAILETTANVKSNSGGATTQEAYQQQQTQQQSQE